MKTLFSEQSTAEQLLALSNKIDELEKPKSDLIQLLSVNNLVPLLVTLITFIIFLVKLQSGNELTQYKIDQLSKKLDGYIDSRTTAAAKMQTMTDMRTSQISALQQDVQGIKIFIKYP